MDNNEIQLFLPFRLSRVTEAISQKIKPIYKDSQGLNRPEWRVLFALADLKSANATQIGFHSALHKTKVSRALAKLEKRRWVHREKDLRDRRFETATLTKLGQQEFLKLWQDTNDQMETLVTKLDQKDRTALLQGLAALERVLE